MLLAVPTFQSGFRTLVTRPLVATAVWDDTALFCFRCVLFLLCFSFSSFYQENKASQEFGVYKFCAACNTCVPSHSHLHSSTGWWSHLMLVSSISSADAPMCSAYSISLLLPHRRPRVHASETTQHNPAFISRNFVMHLLMVRRLHLS
jgi:Pyruvate/2-oxoacid:ferredoxin oxidoreductase delta subunit